MERQILLTADGSHTVSIPSMHVTYHSMYGAIRERLHVFIEAGLRHFLASRPANQSIRMLEVGLGAGLNALLTLQYVINTPVHVFYQAIELYPLTMREAATLNYAAMLNDETLTTAFHSIHNSAWEQEVPIHRQFTLHKSLASLLNLVPSQASDIIYFDPFAPGVQPELWTTDVFRRLHERLHAGGILVTYCSKGDVRRSLQACGFKVEKLPGPPGKREILRAQKS